MQDSHLNYGDEFLRFGYKPNPSGQVDPVVEVFWQPTLAAIERLAQTKATDAHLLIVTESGGNEVDRLVVSLETGRWFVPLRTPGLNHIHATIVWGDNPKDRSAKRRLLAKDSHRDYELNVLREYQPAVAAISGKMDEVIRLQGNINISDDEYEALDTQLDTLRKAISIAYNDDYEAMIRPDIFSDYHDRNTYRQLGAARFSVTVPAQMFAESWAVTKKLGNLFLENPRDQCQLRRRAIITVATAPLWIPLGAILFTAYFVIMYFIGAVIASALLIWGSRNIDFSYFRLNDLSPSGIYADIKPSRWWTKEVKTDQGYGSQSLAYPTRHPVFYFLNPVTLVIVAMIVGVQLYFGVDGWSLTIPFLVIAAIGLAVIAVAVIMTRREDALTTEPPADVARQMVVKRYSPTAVQHAKQTPTLHLRYLETKAKICKPFARRA